MDNLSSSFGQSVDSLPGQTWPCGGHKGQSVLSTGTIPWNMKADQPDDALIEAVFPKQTSFKSLLLLLPKRVIFPVHVLTAICF